MLEARHCSSGTEQVVSSSKAGMRVPEAQPKEMQAKRATTHIAHECSQNTLKLVDRTDCTPKDLSKLNTTEYVWTWDRENIRRSPLQHKSYPSIISTIHYSILFHYASQARKQEHAKLGVLWRSQSSISIGAHSFVQKSKETSKRYNMTK